MYLCTKFYAVQSRFHYMLFSLKKHVVTLAILVVSVPVFANAPQDSLKHPTHTITENVADAAQKVHDDHAAQPTDVKSSIKQFIGHHVLDSHDFTLFSDPETGKHYGFPLPVILWDNGLHVFSSSAFHHGETVVESKGNFYALNHHDGKIYKTDATGAMHHDAKGFVSNERPLDFSITKSVVAMLAVALIMFILFRALGRSYAKNGGIATGVGRFFEPLVMFIRDEIARPNIGEKHYRKYMGFLLTAFFFILFLNIFGLMPFGINATGNISITFGLALVTFLVTNFSAKKDYWGHIFWMPGIPKVMRIILAPIELLGVFIKPFVLMIRLYANILAGHIVLMSIIGLMFIFKSWLGSSLSFGLAFALSILEILVAFLQAYIFTMLSALYFGAAVEEHHHEEAHH
jgi:F-type H+-transporting ATPase subunit a